MPYAEKIIGIYAIINTKTEQLYVGKAKDLKKRRAEHFRLLEKGQHTNPWLQNSYNKHGRDNFLFEIIVECEDDSELCQLENAFLQGDAYYYYEDEPEKFNIALESQAAMHNRVHSEETKRKISESKRGKSPTKESREKSSKAHKELFKNPEHKRKVLEACKAGFTEETKKKLSEQAKKQWQNPEIRKKMLARNKRGGKLSQQNKV